MARMIAMPGVAGKFLDNYKNPSNVGSNAFSGTFDRVYGGLSLLDEKWMKDDSSEFVYIKGSRTAKHVGYYVVPVNPDAGWPGQAGWACAFIQEGKTAEHMMWLIYKSLHHSLLYLIKRPEIANNIATSRRPYKNSMTDFKQPTTEFTNS